MSGKAFFSYSILFIRLKVTVKKKSIKTEMLNGKKESIQKEIISKLRPW